MSTPLGRRVLVTGGAGFVGSHVADAHIAAGDRVWVLDDLSTGRRENVPPRAEFIEMDVADHRTRGVVRRGRFDIVSHHAAQASVTASVEDPVADARVNVTGLLHVLAGAREGGASRVIFASSGGAVYGESSRFPTEETAPKRPLSPYGVAKLAGEHYLYSCCAGHGIEYVALRYSNVFGPRQNPRGEAGVVAIFAQRLLEGEPLVIYGDGEQLRDYVHVEDVARANLLAAAMPVSRAQDPDARAYNVASGAATSVNALAAILEEVAGATGAERRLLPARGGDVRRSAPSPKRLRALGWRPEVGLREGLERTFAHMADARDRDARAADPARRTVAARRRARADRERGPTTPIPRGQDSGPMKPSPRERTVAP